MIHWTEDELKAMAEADAIIDAEDDAGAPNEPDWCEDAKTANARQRKNQSARARYRNDPAFRQKKQQSWRDWKNANPERAKAASRQSSKRYRERQKGKR